MNFHTVKSNKRSKFVYMYDKNFPNDLLKIYDSELEAIIENPRITLSGLKTSSRKNKSYKGFRWFLVNKECIL